LIPLKASYDGYVVKPESTICK